MNKQTMIKRFDIKLISLKTLLKNKMAAFGTLIVITFLITAVFAPFIAPYDPAEQDFAVVLQAPSLAHPFGTDEFGRDILSRIIWGARPTLVIVCVAGLFALLVGGSVGVLSGYYGGWLDMVFMRLLDVMLAFPGILLVLTIINGTGPGMAGVILAIGISSIPQYTRVARASVMSVKENDYVQAARTTGEKTLNIIVHYILPNAVMPVVVLTFLRMATIIILAAGVSFLGLGIQPPTPEWGLMLSQAQKYFRIAPHLSIFPGMAIIVVVFGFNLLGDSLRNALDPKTR